MSPDAFLLSMEKSFMFYLGLCLIFSCPLLIFVSQIGAAIREIAINTRKDEFSSASDYEMLGWVCSILLILSCCFLVAGVVFIVKATLPS